MKKIQGTVAMNDDKGTPYALLEEATGRVLDLNGKYTGRTLQKHGPSHLDTYPEDGDMLMSDLAARYMYRAAGRANGLKSVTMKDSEGAEVQINMDLGVADVHIASALPNFAGGYTLAEGAADVVAPAIVVPKQSDFYNVWDSANTFKRVILFGGGAGAQPPEVNPTKSATQFTAPDYALGAFIPSEVEANADAPLRPFEAAMQMVLDKLRLEREFRVATKLTTSANWNANNVIALSAGAKWNGGATSDPVANMHALEEASFMPISKWIFSEPAYHAFVRNPNVRAYWAYNQKYGSNIPNPSEVQALLKIAPIVIADMKYAGAAGVPTYVWPSALGSTSAVVAVHEAKERMPTSQKDVSTISTFRWGAAPAPDGTLTAGILVRSYWDQNRGPRGGRKLVCSHWDAEVMTSNILGGLVSGVLQ